MATSRILLVAWCYMPPSLRNSARGWSSLEMKPFIKAGWVSLTKNNFCTHVGLEPSRICSSPNSGSGPPRAQEHPTSSSTLLTETPVHGLHCGRNSLCTSAFVFQKTSSLEGLYTKVDLRHNSPLASQAERSGLKGSVPSGTLESRVDLTKWAQRPEVKTGGRARANVRVWTRRYSKSVLDPRIPSTVKLYER
jgi:hypothetical protein